MQKATEPCVGEGVDHLPDFKHTEAGMSSWLCRLCGLWIIEAEDCQL